MVWGRLRAMGFIVRWARLQQAIREVDPLHTALRWKGNLTGRRPYSVPGPNSLWHLGKICLSVCLSTCLSVAKEIFKCILNVSCTATGCVICKNLCSSLHILPRINQALMHFQESWNHHPVSTERGMSPNQLFTSGALRLRYSGLAAVNFFY